MIVVDVGCHPHGDDVSVGPLIDRFHPEILYGFDPYPELEEGVEHVGIGGTLVVRRRAAAWVWNGQTKFSPNGISSSAFPEFMVNPADLVECFDLAAWLLVLPPVDVVLKLDAEGAEYPLLTDLHAKRLDERLSLLLVEWHGTGQSGHPPILRDQLDRDQLLERLRCPVEEWA